MTSHVASADACWYLPCRAMAHTVRRLPRACINRQHCGPLVRPAACLPAPHIPICSAGHGAEAQPAGGSRGPAACCAAARRRCRCVSLSWTMCSAELLVLVPFMASCSQQGWNVALVHVRNACWRAANSACCFITRLCLGASAKGLGRITCLACLCRDGALLLLRSWAPADFNGSASRTPEQAQSDSHALPAEPAAAQLRREVSPELTSYDHRRAHFLAMCMKLVYERPACIEDIAKSR